MRVLYPEIAPHRVHRLAVGDGHVLYVEESGNPDGLPVLFLHGGPGIGCTDHHRRYFDPERYRIVLFDQRGSGRSTPHASLEANTTQHLVADIELIRAELEIDRWLVFGGSWGSTLGLVYAEAYPERVAGLILRGIFLCRDRDIRWFYEFGANQLYPDAWADFLEPIPEAERHEPVAAYYRLLTGDDEISRMAAAKAWSIWEARCATLEPDASLVAHFGDPYVALSMARIECHYFVNHCFLRDEQILADAAPLADIPGVIIHGRHDLVCPLYQAWALHQAWPRAELNIVPGAGHSATEPAIVDALVSATDRFADELA